MKRPRKKPSMPASRRESELAEIDAFIAKHGVTACPAYHEPTEIQLDERRSFYAAKTGRVRKGTPAAVGAG
jgi:hypothetical protein